MGWNTQSRLSDTRHNRIFSMAGFAFLSALFLLGSHVSAQDSGDQPDPNDDGSKVDSRGNKLVPKTGGDPSAGSSLLDPIRKPDKIQPKKSDKPELPEMVVKARIFVRGQEPSAIVMIGETSHTLRKGDSFSTISPASGEAVTITVKELTQQGIKLHAASLNKTLNIK